MVSGPNDTTPFYSPECPKRDVTQHVENPDKNSGVRGKKHKSGQTRKVKVMKEGYVGKTKGKKQVLWERGFG